MTPPQSAGDPAGDAGSPPAPPAPDAVDEKPSCNCHCTCVPIDEVVAHPGDSINVVSNEPNPTTDVYATLVPYDPESFGLIAGIDPSDLIATVDGLVYGGSVLVDAPSGDEYGSPLLGFVPPPPLGDPGPIDAGVVDIDGHFADVVPAGLVSAALQDERGPLLVGFSSQLGGLPTAAASGPAAPGPGVALGRTDVSAIGPTRVAFEAPVTPVLDASTQLPTVQSAGRDPYRPAIGPRRSGGSLH